MTIIPKPDYCRYCGRTPVQAENEACVLCLDAGPHGAAARARQYAEELRATARAFLEHASAVEQWACNCETIGEQEWRNVASELIAEKFMARRPIPSC